MQSFLKTATLFLIVAYAIGAACTVAAVVTYDLIALRNGWRTVSNDTFRLGHIHVSFLVTATGTLCLAMGMLIGHLFLGQSVQSPCECPKCGEVCGGKS